MSAPFVNQINPAGTTAGQVVTSTGPTTAPAWAAPAVQTGTTNLTYTAAPTQGTVVSDTGTDAVIPAATGVNAGLFLPAEKTKLASLPSGPLATVATTGSYMDLTDAPAPTGQPNQQIAYGTGTGLTSSGNLKTDGTALTRTSATTFNDLYVVNGHVTIVMHDESFEALTVPGDGENGTLYQMAGGVTVLSSANNIANAGIVTDARHGILVFDGTNVVPATSHVNGYGAFWWNNTTKRLNTHNGTAIREVAYTSDVPTSFKQTVGDGSTTAFVINHNLNSLDVVVQVYRVSDGQVFAPDISGKTVNALTLTFAVAPAAGEYRILILAV